MFKNLFNFEYKRTGIEALGFYIVYTILFVAFLSLINGVIANIIYPDLKTASFHEGVEKGRQTAMIVMPVLLLISSGILSIAILIAKKIYTVGAILLTILAICLTSIFGAIIGVIPIAILTTFDNKNS